MTRSLLTIINYTIVFVLSCPFRWYIARGWAPIWGQRSPLMKFNFNLIQKRILIFWSFVAQLFFNYHCWSGMNLVLGRPWDCEIYAVECIPDMKIIKQIELAVWCCTSFALTSTSRSCNVSLWHFCSHASVASCLLAPLSLLFQNNWELSVGGTLGKTLVNSTLA